MFLRYAAVCSFLILSTVSSAQSSDNWLMQNYRFAGPPAPDELRSTDPVVAELKKSRTPRWPFCAKLTLPEISKPLSPPRRKRPPTRS